MAEQNFEMSSGDAKTITVTVLDSAGAAKNITGYTAGWKLSKHPRATAILAKTGTLSGTPTNGIFTVSLVAADTSTLEGVYYQEAWVIDGSSNATTVMEGYATIHRSVKP